MSGSEDHTIVGAILIGMVMMPSGAVEASQPRALPRAVSGFVSLQQQGSGMMPTAPIITKGSADALDLVSHLRPC